jgi:hypothetical protein
MIAVRPFAPVGADWRRDCGATRLDGGDEKSAAIIEVLRLLN